jgi:repressor LexA
MTDYPHAKVPLTRRQRDIVTFFQAYTEDQGISPTLEEIAQHFGVNKVTIFGHVAELERKGVIERSAKGISRGLRLVESDDPQQGDDGEGADGAIRGGLRILGTIAAGAPIETLEAPEVLPFAELAPPGKDVYVLRVSGNSMIEDSIRDGDLVVVERCSGARRGQTVVAVLPGEEATLKRYYPEADGSLRLQPANATMAPIIVPPELAPEVELRGIVIGVIRRY